LLLLRAGGTYRCSTGSYFIPNHSLSVLSLPDHQKSCWCVRCVTGEVLRQGTDQGIRRSPGAADSILLCRGFHFPDAQIRAGPHLQNAGLDNGIPGSDAFHNLNKAFGALPDLHHLWHSFAVLDQEHFLA